MGWLNRYSTQQRHSLRLRLGEGFELCFPSRFIGGAEPCEFMDLCNKEKDQSSLSITFEMYIVDDTFKKSSRTLSIMVRS